MVVHHAVGINRKRNSGYRPRRVNIMAQGLSTPDPSLSHTHLSIEVVVVVVVVVVAGEVAQQIHTSHTIRLA